MEETPSVQRFDDFLNAAIQVAETIKKMEPPIQIYYANTVDSTIAASIFAQAFFSKEQPCHLKIFNKFKEVKEEFELGEFSSIVIGLTLNEAKQVQGREEPTLLLPKHEQDTEIIQNTFHAGVYGYTQELATLSAAAFFITSSILDRVEPILIHPLAAALATHGTIKGLSEMILHDALEADVIQQKTGLKILGGSYFSIAEAIYYSSLPVLPGLTGNKNAVEKMLAKAGVETEDRQGERTLEQLSENEMKKLVSAIVVETTGNKFLAQSVMPVGEVFISKIEPKGSILSSLHEYAQLLRDMEHSNQLHLAIPILLGERDEIYYSVRTKGIETRKRPVAVFNQLQARPEPESLNHLSFAEADGLPWQYVEAVSKIMVANGLIPPEAAIAIITQTQENLAVGLTLPKSFRKEKTPTDLFNEIQRQTGLGLKVLTMPEGTVCIIDKDMEKQFLEKIDSVLDDWLKQG